MIDLFAVASAEEVAALIDPEAFVRLGIQKLVDAVDEFAADLEAPALEDGGVRVGIRLPGRVWVCQRLAVWALPGRA